MSRHVITPISYALPLVLLMAACSGDDTTPTGPSTSPVTDVFASHLSARGESSRSFNVRDTGTIEVTLTSVNPAAVIGLGVGIPRKDGAGCALSRSMDTGAAPDPQIVMTADGGTFCVKVYDVGNVSESAAFSVTIVHP